MGVQRTMGEVAPLIITCLIIPHYNKSQTELPQMSDVLDQNL